MNDTPALSATLESVLIRKPLPKHVLDLRAKSKMMTKNRFSDGFTGWSSLVGSSINNCMAIVARKRRDVSNSTWSGLWGGALVVCKEHRILGPPR